MQNPAATLMLDTVTFTNWPTRKSVPAGQMLKIDAIKVYPDASGTMFKRVEFSAPRILHGHNGAVIRDQGELDAAIAKVREMLEPFAKVPSVLHPSRIDIAWNYSLSARPIMVAYSGTMLPGVRGLPTSFRGAMTGISWRGGKSQFMLKLYDKALKIRGVQGSFLRAEVSLRGEQLTKRLPGEKWNSLPDLWRVYRGVLVSLPAIEICPEKWDWPEAVGRAPAEVQAQVLALLMQTKSPRTIREYKRRMAIAASRLVESFSWESYLPHDCPPPPVDVMPKT